MYDVKEPGEKLWQVNEKNSTGDTVYQSRVLFAKSRKQAKEQYTNRYKKYERSRLTAIVIEQE